MKMEEMDQYVGKKVRIHFPSGARREGVLEITQTDRNKGTISLWRRWSPAPFVGNIERVEVLEDDAPASS